MVKKSLDSIRKEIQTTQLILIILITILLSTGSAVININSHEKAFEVMLRILTQRDDLHVIKVRTQYNIRNLVGHSVVLDGFAEDSQGKLYNIEVQVETSYSKFMIIVLDNSFSFK